MQNNKYLLPLSIVIAGVLVSGTIYFTKSTDKTKTIASVSDIAAEAMQPKTEVLPVTGADHIRGNKDAKIKLIVYTDPECPFCKGYYKNINDLYNSYPNKNDLAIVYRHFPLEQLHPKALKESEALECAAEIGGEDSFWKFNDILYAETPANNQLDPAKLNDFATRINLDLAKFKSCLSSGKYTQKIAEAVDAGHNAGGQGTPYSVIQVKNQFVPLVDKNGSSLGMLPVNALKSIVEQLSKI
jgi:protein-disulfide isomerase